MENIINKSDPHRPTRALVIAAAQLVPLPTKGQVARMVGVTWQRVSQIAAEEQLVFTVARKTKAKEGA